MFKKCSIILGITVLIMVIGLGLTACGENSSQSTFKGTDLAGNKYTLKIFSGARALSEGDEYELIIETADGDEFTVNGEVDNIYENQLTLADEEGGDFDVVLSGSNISAIIGEITLPDGSVFIVRTFAEIHLRVNRWTGLYGNGENYTSGESIKLSDIYKGDIKNLIKPSEEISKIKLSGTVDKDLKNVDIGFAWVIDDGFWGLATDYEFKWLDLGGSGLFHDLEFTEVPQGDFEIDFQVNYNKHNDYFKNDLPPGEVYLAITEVINNVQNEYLPHNVHFGEIPKNIPDYAVMATIKNLRIEPVLE